MEATCQRCAHTHTHAGDCGHTHDQQGTGFLIVFTSRWRSYTALSATPFLDDSGS